MTHSTVMLNTVVEAYRDGALVAGPIPYAGHPENARHLARRTGLESGADFVRVLDESGKEEQWSERLGEQPANLASPGGAKVEAPENDMPSLASQGIDEKLSSPIANAGGRKKI
ncbi:MAG TPA: hypothetical protein VIL63_12160 [Terriglobales bacterium]